jgi:AraC-like DNA-binding protein
MTPRAFAEEPRVAHAKRLLEETTRPVAEIALDAGLGTQSRLRTTFRRRTGFTPAAYRRGIATGVQFAPGIIQRGQPS